MRMSRQWLALTMSAWWPAARALYIGVSAYLLRRLFEHRTHAVPGHSDHYRATRLVRFEETDDPLSAMARGKQLKGWRREKKIALFDAHNPTWEDFAADGFG